MPFPKEFKVFAVLLMPWFEFSACAQRGYAALRWAALHKKFLVQSRLVRSFRLPRLRGQARRAFRPAVLWLVKLDKTIHEAVSTAFSISARLKAAKAASAIKGEF